ncbi:MAG TPA: LON peptidase substrate-binding domain-containing protein [Aggregatilineaceae bacterium]|nr:LON peptidase substrate-binding domain-containing protein [Aggregatilineaceae bacterium]
MFRLPLFPLNTVLFPGTPITLHIFEPRYQAMMKHCLDTHQPFGVVLIKEGTEALGPLAQPYPIGCTAQITQVERLPEGRMNIVAIGLERFQIHTLSHEQPYLVGMVELLPLDHVDRLDIAEEGDLLRPWVERYLSVLARAANDFEFDVSQLPEDPLALAYLAAMVVQIPMVQKQTLLSALQASEFLSGIRTIYQREVPLLDAIMSRDMDNPNAGLFSAN